MNGGLHLSFGCVRLTGPPLCGCVRPAERFFINAHIYNQMLVRYVELGVSQPLGLSGRDEAKEISRTYQELLNLATSSPCQSNDFIEKNKIQMACLELNKDDYETFWGYIKIYEAIGVDYLGLYLKIIMQDFGDFSGGIEKWATYKGKALGLWNGDIQPKYFDDLARLISSMKFFGINQYGEQNLNDLEQMQKAASTLWHKADKRELNSMNSTDVPIWEKYTLTIEEAAQYFRIGENKLRKLAAENPDASWILMNGNRIQIKRKLFEKFIDMLEVL